VNDANLDDDARFAAALPALPAGLHQSFHQAAAELGMVSAAWLFAREVERAGGKTLLRALRDDLGRAYPVLDAVVARRLAGAASAGIDVTAVLEACADAHHVLFVGLETCLLDPVVAALATRKPRPRLHLLTQRVFQPDWQRVAANFGGDVELVGLDRFQRCAGPRSVLVTPVYGSNPDNTYALPALVRASGADVRTQFRALVGVEVLGQSFYVYPRWLVEVPRRTFTEIVKALDDRAPDGGAAGHDAARGGDAA
jgi:hypothetical protein